MYIVCRVLYVLYTYSSVSLYLCVYGDNNKDIVLYCWQIKSLVFGYDKICDILIKIFNFFDCYIEFA